MTDIWRRYLGYYRPVWKTIVATSLVSVLQAALGLPIAWQLKRLFDGSSGGGLAVGLSLASIVLLYLLGDALLIYSVRRNLGLVKPVVKQLRLDLVERVLLRPAPSSRTETIGAIHGALLQDAERIDEMSAALICRLLPALLSISVLFTILATLSLALFVVALVVMPLGWLVTAWFRRKVRARVAAFDASRDRYNSGVLGLLQRLELTRSHGAEGSEIARHSQLARELAEDGMSVASSGTALFVLHNQIAVFTAIGVIFAGRQMMVSGSLTIGTLLAFYIVLAMTRGHLTSIATQLPSVLSGHAALHRIFPLINSAAESPYKGKKIIPFDGGVDLVGVHYGYTEAPVLENVDLAMPPGQMTALTGPNGAGKTTIARLVLGLDRPDQGYLKADGIAYDDLAIDALRSKMAFAAQDPMIFVGTVRENLLFGLGRAVESAEIDEVLELVGAGFVAMLEQGLDSWLGDSGVRLSGGQRQRLSIARAILRQPALLILDEPTNHLGTAEGQAIIKRIRHRDPAITILLISHDQGLLALADNCWRATSTGLLSAAA